MRRFLGKLIMPAAEEFGLLLRDIILVWRLKAAIRQANREKAKNAARSSSDGRASGLPKV